MIKLCAFADEYSNSLNEQIEGLTKNKIGYIELRNLDGKNVADLTNEEAEDCYLRLCSANISVWSIGSPIGKVDITCNFEEYKKKVERICEIANILHCEKIRMFSFFKAYEDREKVLTYLNGMVSIASRYGVGLYHENEKDIYGDTIARVQDLMENVNGLKFVYDPANFVQCEQDCTEALSKLKANISYFHVKDVDGDGDLVPAGEGLGKIDELIESIDGDAVITVEPHLAIFEGYSTIDNTEMKNKHKFDSNKDAFDYAVNALKVILKNHGYKEDGISFIK